MRRIASSLATILLAVVAAAQTGEPLLTAEQLPDASKFLPPPPEEDSPAFVYDLICYYEGKELRDTPRGQRAIREATVNVDSMAAMFSSAFGMKLSREETPAIMELLSSGVRTIRLGATKPKAAYMRLRPYVRLCEPTLIPEEEDELRDTGSYPSGHTVRGWGMALMLTEINPAAQDTLMSMGYEWGRSRVIAGYHWQSDVDAARLLASACYASLHSNPQFLYLMAQAREEYEKKRQAQSSLSPFSL